MSRSRLRRSGLRVMAETVALGRRLVTGRWAVSAADIATLRSRVRGLSPLPSPACESEATWLGYRRRFREDLLTRDPRRFLRWPVLRPMYRRDASYLGPWLAYLRAQPDWHARWRPAVRESAVGDPRPFIECRASSGNLLNQAFHVRWFEDVTGTRLADVDLIFEFGAGYGALCRLVHALGFRGAYALYDFPEFSALQEFYLRAHGLLSATPRAEAGPPSIATLSTPVELDEWLGHRGRGRAAFVALWSLSETPLALREAVAARMTTFDEFVIAYQPRFGEVDNVAWFDALRRRLDDAIDWHDASVPHREPNRYLFGVRRPADARRGERPAPPWTTLAPRRP